MADSPRSRPKGDKRERTRAALIEAAAAVVREKGHERTTLEDVARRAGMTRGAIYGNFKDKDELFMAIAAVRWEPIYPPPPAPGTPLADQMRSIADAVIAAVPARAAAAVGFASFQQYALTHPQIRAQVVAANGQIYRMAEQAVRAFVDPADLPMPPETFVRVVHALTEGLLYQRYFLPELVTDEVIYEAFAALARNSQP